MQAEQTRFFALKKSILYSSALEILSFNQLAQLKIQSILLLNQIIKVHIM